MKLDESAQRDISDLPPGILVASVRDLSEELTAFATFASSKLAPTAWGSFQQLKSQLEGIQKSARGKDCRWKSSLPVETSASDGMHQPSREGRGTSLFGKVSFTWQVRPLGEYTKKAAYRRLVAVYDSSVTVALCEEATKKTLREWKFDVGNHESPGCHFHAAFSDARSAGHNVDVPRLPTIIFMPTDALDFVLGELWQDDWPKLAIGGAAAQTWARFASARMQSVLEWQTAKVSSSTGSPWMMLKAAKPKHSEVPLF